MKIVSERLVDHRTPSGLEETDVEFILNISGFKLDSRNPKFPFFLLHTRATAAETCFITSSSVCAVKHLTPTQSNSVKLTIKIE